MENNLIQQPKRRNFYGPIPSPPTLNVAQKSESLKKNINYYQINPIKTNIKNPHSNYGFHKAPNYRVLSAIPGPPPLNKKKFSPKHFTHYIAPPPAPPPPFPSNQPETIKTTQIPRQNAHSTKPFQQQYVSYHNNNFNNFIIQAPNLSENQIQQLRNLSSQLQSAPPPQNQHQQYVNPFLSASAFHQQKFDSGSYDVGDGNNENKSFYSGNDFGNVKENLQFVKSDEKVRFERSFKNAKKPIFIGKQKNYYRWGVPHPPPIAEMPYFGRSSAIKRSGFEESPREIRPGKRRPRKMFTDEEVNNLIQGVTQFGHGKWARILQFFEFDDRTAVDLKDKWRNLQKPSSTVKVPKGRRTRLPYSESECQMLQSGVRTFGHNWVAILRAFPFHSDRTPVDLKDKWRNLQIKSGKISPPPKKQRRFLLLDSDNTIFMNVYPRDAALKAAARGCDYIKLLQIGTPRIHVFAGERSVVQRYIGRQKGSVWKGRVLKLGMERATVEQLKVAKARFAQQFGLDSAHEIAPNVEVNPLSDCKENVVKGSNIFTSKKDVAVMSKLKIKKESFPFKEYDQVFKNDEY